MVCSNDTEDGDCVAGQPFELFIMLGLFSHTKSRFQHVFMLGAVIQLAAMSIFFFF